MALVIKQKGNGSTNEGFLGSLRAYGAVKAPVVDFFARLAVVLALDKTARSSVSLV